MTSFVDERSKHFFLEGATEPVSLEFAFATSNNINEILRVLEENGLQVTDNIADTDKIFIGKEALITPPLRPQDVGPLFEILENALEEANCYIASIPHLIDLKSITPCGCLPQDIINEQEEIRRKHQSELKNGEFSFEDHMINEAKSSGKLIKVTSHNHRVIPAEVLQSYKPEELLFNGSTLSDPYSTATQLIRRNVRMASSDLRDAVRYSHTGGDSEKSMCANQLVTKGKQRYGFMHAYKASYDQCYYSGIGIEFNSRPCYRGVQNEETMVNRFKNPCVGEYVVFKERTEEEMVYYLFPIPEDDKRWQDFKKLSISPNVDLSYDFAMRHNLLYKEKDCPKTVIPLVKDAYDENGINKEFFTRRVEAVKSDLAAIRKNLEDIAQYIKDIENKATELQSAKISFEEKKQELKKMEEEAQKKREESIKLADRARQYNPKGYLESLEKEIHDATEPCRSIKPLNFFYLLENLKKIEQDRLRIRYNKIRDMERKIENNAEFINSSDLSSLSKEERKDLMKMIMRTQYRLSRENLKNAINIYISSASIEERMNLFEDIFTLTANRKHKFASTMRKDMKNDPDMKEYPELKELLKRDNLFVKHTLRARKIVQNIFELSKTSLQR